MERPELAEDPRYDSPSNRSAHRFEVREIVEEWTSVRTRAEIVTALGGIVPVGPVNTVADIVEDPHVAAREMIVDVEQPGAGRDVSIAGSPIKLSETPSAVKGRAPLLDEHSDDIRDAARRWL